MNAIELIIDALSRISPNFREATRERNKIKSEYRNILRDIETDNEFRTLHGYKKEYLGNDLEDMHRRIEKKIIQSADKNGKLKSFDKTYRHISGESYNDFERHYGVEVAQEDKEDLIEDINLFIAKIERKNTWSRRKEGAFWGTIFVAILLFVYVLF
ncbi:hypothetical protein [Halorubrum vacuolatum]|uniref:hypothetical protein n=1 Tax=Halorubrum vacuolatum TaxID=63740 RepID=UPI00117B671B|nr:hypothetical protein [Halorubrum vacuolatum]